MIELRDYQKELLARVESELRPDKARVMMQLPTGGGKTVIAAHLLKNWLTPGRNSVWLTHRKELVSQTRRMLSDAGIAVYPGDGWATGTPAPMINGGVIILMAQTVSRRIARAGVWKSYAADDLMIIDEAHHATAKGWERAIRRFPGKAVGMTATPWRLSQIEGFDHLFRELVCGPDVPDLQESDFLCNAKVLIPTPEYRIQGGEIGSIGDYTEGGIERANQEHIMTAGVLEFWKNHARDRQTIIYAVSVRHARNLAALFVSEGIPTAAMLGNTPQQMRDAMITKFSDGELRVLVNVAVATEGFDLPDASCVVIARPTQSLALYLQMLGRGLRPKHDGGDCLILDLAGNAILHGLPQQPREWSLVPRGQLPEGEAPVVWCEHCGAVSPAASHNCQSCGAPFGEDCQRCGKWRSRSRWSLRDRCEYAHDIVCDRCHMDAHLQNHLPVTAQMEALAMFDDEDEEMTIDGRLALLLKSLLEEERRRISGLDEDEKYKLREFIKTREAELSDESVLNDLFEEHLDALPVSRQPRIIVQKYRLYTQWEGNLRAELAEKRNELAQLESQPIDKRAILDSAQDRVLSLLTQEAKVLGLLPHSGRTAADSKNVSNASVNSSPLQVSTPRPPLPGAGWIPLTGTNLNPTGKTPVFLSFPSGKEVVVNSWADSMVEIANWLVGRGKLSHGDCPVPTGKSAKTKTYLINTTPYHSDGSKFTAKRKLSNGLFLYTTFNAKSIISKSGYLLRVFGEDPSQFHIKLQ